MSALIYLVESIESLWQTILFDCKSEKFADKRSSNYQPISIISGNGLEPRVEKESTVGINRRNQLLKTEQDQQQLQSSSVASHEDNCYRVTNSLAVNEDSHFLKWMFDLIDENKDGLVSVEELKLLLQRLGSTDMSEAAMSAALLHLNKPDYNKTQHLSTQFDFAQFTNLYASIMREVPNRQLFCTDASMGTEHNSLDPTECQFLNNGEDSSDVDTEEDQLLYDAFRLYDKNGDGLISADEMTSVLTELGLLKDHSITTIENKNAYCQTLIDRVDINGDGFVDLHEFKVMMTDSNKTNMP